MDGKDVEGFKSACREYFKKTNINTLRSYGRTLQLRTPSIMKKEPLIEEIIGVLCGEITPQRNGKRGAPSRGECVSQKLLDDILFLKDKYLGEAFVDEKDEESLGDLSMKCTVNFTRLSKEQKQRFLSFLHSL